MRKILITFFSVTIILLTGCAFTNNQVSMKKARVIYFVPKTVSSEKVKAALLNAITMRTQDVRDYENFMPEKLPEQPGHPVRKNIFGALNAIAAGNPQLEAAQLDTSNAWYSVQGIEQMGTLFNKVYVVYKGAIYPYKDGYKVYIYEFYQEGIDGIMGHITKSLVKVITKEDAPLLFIAQISNRFKEKIPEAKLESAFPEVIKKIKLNLLTEGNFGLDK